MKPVILLSLFMGLVAQAMTTMESYIPTPADMPGLPQMVGSRDSTPSDSTDGLFRMSQATFFYTFDNGTEFSYEGEPQDFERELKKHMPQYEMRQLTCGSGTAPPPSLPKRFMGPRHDEDDHGAFPPAPAAVPNLSSPRLERRWRSDTPGPGGNLINCMKDFGPVKDSVECLVRDLVDDDSHESQTIARVEANNCARIRCNGDGASLYWCNLSYHPKRTPLSTFAVPVADLHAKCGGKQNAEGGGWVEGNAWNDYNHTLADARVYVGKCDCATKSSQCGPHKNGLLGPGYSSDTT